MGETSLLRKTPLASELQTAGTTKVSDADPDLEFGNMLGLSKDFQGAREKAEPWHPQIVSNAKSASIDAKNYKVAVEKALESMPSMTAEADRFRLMVPEYIENKYTPMDIAIRESEMKVKPIPYVPPPTLPPLPKPKPKVEKQERPKSSVEPKKEKENEKEQEKRNVRRRKW